MSPPPERGASLPGWLIPLLVATIAALQLVAFHWGVILPDTLVQYGQALSGDYADWHPPVMAWLWRGIGAARFGSAPMLLLDLALLWLGLGLIAEALRRHGRPVAALLAVGIGALPIVFGQLGAILKDTLLAATLTAAAGLAAWYHLRERPMAWSARVLFAALLSLAAAARVNAPLACAPLLLLALPRLPRRIGGKLLAFVAALTLAFAANRTIDQLLLRPHAQHPLLSQVNIDLAGITLRSGTNVYPATVRPPVPLLAACYTPAQFNPHYDDRCNSVEDGLHTLYDVHPGAVGLWLRAIAAHPLAYAGHRLAHFNANQRWLVARVPDDAVFVTSTPNDLGLSFHANRLTAAVHRAATALAWSPLGRPATWLAAAAALLIIGAPALPSALALSALLYGFGYTVASVAPDLRYNLWTMIAAQLAWVTAGLGPIRTGSMTRRIAALVVLGGTLVGEAIAVLAG